MISERRIFDANLETVSDMLKFITALFMDFSGKTAYDTKLICEEILVNIASYAYPEGNGKVAILWENDTDKREVSIVFEDSGIPFNPLLNPEPEIGAPIAERKIGGMGISIARKLSDTINYNYTNGKNILTVTKKY